MKLKKITKTKTLICAGLYDSPHYRVSYNKLKFIDSCIQLARDFPNTFQIIESSMVHVIIKTIDLKHCFELYKYNESKVIIRA